METLLGGADYPVTKLDGTVVTVLVRQLPLSDFPTLLARMEDEPSMAELYCGQKAGWAATLTLESLEKVIEAGERLNEDFFARWLARRLKRQERLMPGLTEKLMASAWPTSPPKSLSPPA